MNRHESISHDASQIERIYDQLDALAPPPAKLLARFNPTVLHAEFDRPVSATDVSSGDIPARWEVVRQLHDWCRDQSRTSACADGSRAALAPDWRAFWTHGLAVGLAVAGAVTSSRAGELFACGLLHDIGRAALALALPRSYARVSRRAASGAVDQAGGTPIGPGSDLGAIERLIMGIDHTQAGRRVAERWGLARTIVDCIWLHHTAEEALPTQVAAAGHVQLVRWADSLICRRGIARGDGRGEFVEAEPVESPVGLTAEQVEEWTEAVVEEAVSFGDWLARGRAKAPTGERRSALKDLAPANVADELEAGRRQLARHAACFTAIEAFSRSIVRGMGLRDVCAAAGDAICSVYKLPAAVVLCRRDDRRWLEYAAVGPLADRGVLESPGVDTPRGASDGQPGGVDAPASWVAIQGGEMQALSARFRMLLGAGPIWWLPLTHGDERLGGALVASATRPAHGATLDGPHVEDRGPAALHHLIAMALRQARAEASMASLRDDLAEVNRRILEMREKVVRSRAVESVASMAAGAAHELNNPLAVISGRAQMLRGRATTAEDREVLDQIVRQAHAASELVSRLVEFAEPPESRPAPIALSDWVRQCRAAVLKRANLQPDELLVAAASDTPIVYFDPELLNQTLQEVVDNAAAAMDGGVRRLTIKAFGDCAEECGVVQVADNGHGMASDVLARAMDPFFSHRPAGRRNGLGLARVQRWVAAGGGSVRIRSTPDVGTTVELRLPSRRHATQG